VERWKGTVRDIDIHPAVLRQQNVVGASGHRLDCVLACFNLGKVAALRFSFH
jgi:hypothetical protein